MWPVGCRSMHPCGEDRGALPVPASLSHGSHQVRIAVITPSHCLGN